MNIHDTYLHIERLTLKASQTKDARIAEKAIVLAQELAASQTADEWHCFAALVIALKLRSKYGLDFTTALLDISARREKSSLDPARKAKRKNLAAIAQKHIDDPSVAAWLKDQDLTFTATDLVPLHNESR